MEQGKKYKDGLFRDYFGDKERLMSLINALLKLNITDVDEIEINTLEGVFFGNLKNDLSCIVQNKLIFITEAQSTPNPNMPARMLFYGTELIKDYLSKINKKLYGANLVKLAAPKFFVIYTGKREEPLYSELSLKDAFLDECTLDLKVKVININSKNASRFLKKSLPLKDYTLFLRLVRKFEKKGTSRPGAIRAAIKYAIEKGIMSEYLKSREAEVFNMVGFEWNEEEAKAYWKQEAFEDGMNKGEKKGKREGITFALKNLMDTMNLSADKAMDVLKIPTPDRRKYKKALI